MKKTTAKRKEVHFLMKNLVFFSCFFFSQASSGIGLHPLSYLLKKYSPVQEVDKDSSYQQLSRLKGLQVSSLQLKRSCEYTQEQGHFSKWEYVQMKRSVLATLQRLGIDLSIKQVGLFMRGLEWSKEEVREKMQSYVSSSCSKNLSVKSRKRILEEIIETFNSSSLVFNSIDKSPFFEPGVKDKIVVDLKYKQRSLLIGLKLLRSMCSWGGDPNEPRLLVPFLQSPLVMSWVFEHLLGTSAHWDFEERELKKVEIPSPVQVACFGPICRKQAPESFKRMFPRAIDSKLLKDELEGLYCQDLIKSKYNFKHPSKAIREWIKGADLEHQKWQINMILEEITKVPSLFLSLDSYEDFRSILWEKIDFHLDLWASKTLDIFKSDLPFEESLEITLPSKQPLFDPQRGQFQLVAYVTMGEWDKLTSKSGFISLSFPLRFPSHFLSQSFVNLRSRRFGEKTSREVMKRMVFQLENQVKESSELFSNPLWKSQLAQLAAREIMRQMDLYDGPGNPFETFQSIEIPLQFRYGTFALKYIREKLLYGLKEKQFSQLLENQKVLNRDKRQTPVQRPLN
jgi:hypothetical protein